MPNQKDEIINSNDLVAALDRKEVADRFGGFNELSASFNESLTSLSALATIQRNNRIVKAYDVTAHYRKATMYLYRLQFLLGGLTLGVSGFFVSGGVFQCLTLALGTTISYVSASRGGDFIARRIQFALQNQINESDEVVDAEGKVIDISYQKLKKLNPELYNLLNDFSIPFPGGATLREVLALLTECNVIYFPIIQPYVKALNAISERLKLNLWKLELVPSGMKSSTLSIQIDGTNNQRKYTSSCLRKALEQNKMKIISFSDDQVIISAIGYVDVDTFVSAYKTYANQRIEENQRARLSSVLSMPSDSSVLLQEHNAQPSFGIKPRKTKQAANDTPSHSPVLMESKSQSQSVEITFPSGEVYRSDCQGRVIPLKATYWRDGTHYGLFSAKKEDFPEEKAFQRARDVFLKGKVVKGEKHVGIVPAIPPKPNMQSKAGFFKVKMLGAYGDYRVVQTKEAESAQLDDGTTVYLHKFDSVARH